MNKQYLECAPTTSRDRAIASLRFLDEHADEMVRTMGDMCLIGARHIGGRPEAHGIILSDSGSVVVESHFGGSHSSHLPRSGDPESGCESIVLTTNGIFYSQLTTGNPLPGVDLYETFRIRMRPFGGRHSLKMLSVGRTETTQAILQELSAAGHRMQNPILRHSVEQAWGNYT